MATEASRLCGGGGDNGPTDGPLIPLKRGADLRVIKAAETAHLDHGHDVVVHPGSQGAEGDAQPLGQLHLCEQLCKRSGNLRRGAWGVGCGSAEG